MAENGTPQRPWERVSDTDYMSTKVLVWATLLGRAGIALEAAEEQFRDVPGVRDAKDRLDEAMQLVGIVEEDLQPLSIYLKPAPLSVEVVPG
jgi:hypothetical protein